LTEISPKLENQFSLNFLTKFQIRFLSIYFFRDWEYYINLAGTELPLHDINEFTMKLKDKVPFSIYSNFDQHDSQRAKWMEERWSYKFKEKPTR